MEIKCHLRSNYILMLSLTHRMLTRPFSPFQGRDAVLSDEALVEVGIIAVAREARDLVDRARGGFDQVHSLVHSDLVYIGEGGCAKLLFEYPYDVIFAVMQLVAYIRKRGDMLDIFVYIFDKAVGGIRLCRSDS